VIALGSAARKIVVEKSVVDEIAGRLRDMFAARDDHALFFDAADQVSYGFAVEVMDQARAGGAVTIAPLTAALEAATPGAPSGS